MDNLLKFAIKEKIINQLLSFMMSKESFCKILSKLNNVNDIEEMHKYILQKIIDHINSILYFGGDELVVVGNQFLVKKVEETINIEIPNINIVDRKYIKNLSERAMKDISDGNMDSAITKSRTILEETFCYVIESKNEIPSDSGDIGKLYKQEKDLYNMHSDKIWI